MRKAREAGIRIISRLKRKLRGLENRLRKEHDELSKDVTKLAKREFACEADALKELNRFIAMHQSELYPLSCTTAQEMVRKKRNKKGRPAVGEVPEYEDIFTIKRELIQLFATTKGAENML